MVNNQIPVVIAFTPNYFIPACVTVLSVLKNSSSENAFRFICLLSESLPQSLKDDFQRIVGSSTNVSFIEMDQALSNVYVVEKYTIAASYRLLIPDLLPQYDKALYLDCDLIVQNDIAKLFLETELGNYYMAGVKEATLPEQENHLRNIKCNAGEYFNSGFLLMNLKKLREDNMVNKFLKASEDDTLEFPDQDVINILCKGNLLALEPYWNSIRTFALPQFKNSFLKFYTELDWNNIQNFGNIHYTGPKPWNIFTIKFELWWRYYMEIPTDIRREYPISKKMYNLYRVYKIPICNLIINSLQKFYRQFNGRHS